MLHNDPLCLPEYAERGWKKHKNAESVRVNNFAFTYLFVGPIFLEHRVLSNCVLETRIPVNRVVAPIPSLSLTGLASRNIHCCSNILQQCSSDPGIYNPGVG